MSDLDERSDADGIRRGDREAFARIVVRHQQAVASQMRMFSREATVVEDLVQDVFVEAYASLHRYREQGAFSSWLAKIATRVGYRYWKRQNRVREQVRDESWWQDLAHCPLEQIDPARAEELVHFFLDQLPPRDRLITLLLYVEGHSVDAAAQLTGWSKSMVKVQAFRARGKIRRRLASAGITSLADVTTEGLSVLFAGRGVADRLQQIDE